MVRSSANDRSGLNPLRHYPGKNFLDLPAEIRNSIYELAAVHNKPVNLVNVAHCTRHRLTRPRILVSHTRWPLNLAQSCRQTRAEYLPICLRDTAVKIRILQINLYLDTFVNPQVRKHQLKDVPGNITLSTYIDEIEHYQINLLPLTKLYNACPRLNVRCHVFHWRPEMEWSAEALLCALLNKHKSATWTDSLEKVVSGATVVLALAEHSPQVLIYVKKEYAEEWMYKDWGHGRKMKFEWAKRIGLMPEAQIGKRLRKALREKHDIDLWVQSEDAMGVFPGKLQC